MSQFIVSYFKTEKESKMKIHSHFFKNQWAIFPIPFAYIYLETFHPESHVPFFKNKVQGFYISFNWLKYTYNFGVYKKI